MKDTGPTTGVIRFPSRAEAVWLVRERDGAAWLALVGPNGWSFGDRLAAERACRWLSRNFGGLPIREVSP